MSNNDNGLLSSTAQQQDEHTSFYQELLEDLREALTAAGMLPCNLMVAGSEFAHV